MLTPLLVATILTARALAGDDTPDDKATAVAMAEARQLLEQAELDAAAERLEAVMAMAGAQEQLAADMLERARSATRDAALLLAEVQVAREEPLAAAELLENLSAGEDAEVQLAIGRAYRTAAEQQASWGGSAEDVGFYYELARASLEKAARYADHGDVRAAVDAGNVILYQMGDHETAIRLANEAVSGDPENGEALLLRGCAGVYDYWNAFASGDEEGAGKLWERAVDDLESADRQLGENRAEPPSQLTWLYEQKGEALDAVDAATEVVVRVPDANFSTLYRLAHRYASEGEYVASAEALEFMVDTRPDEVAEWLAAEDDPTAVAETLSFAPLMHQVNRGDLNTARRIFASLVQADPESAGLWNNYGLLCRDTGKYAESYRAYNRSIEIDDSDPRVVNDTALILHYHLLDEIDGAYDRAHGLYEQAIALAEAEMASLDQMDIERRAYISEALRDARNNLRKLESGSRRDG